MRILVIATLISATSLAHADRRAFTRTYEYQTMPMGDLELELYSTESRPVLDEDSRAFELMLELEYGITSRWDLSVYHVFEQASGYVDPAENQDFHFSELKLRTRYRFAERGELPVDILLYGEAAKSFAEDLYELEAKLILARDFGPVTVVTNLINEVVLGDAEEYEQGFTVGVTYEIVPAFKAGAETWASMELQEGELGGWSAGPALSWAPSPRFWWALTVGFGLNDDADDLNVRSIFAMHL